MKLVVSAFLIFLTLVVCAEPAKEIPKAKLTVLVVDEAGTPIDGVNVRLGFKDADGSDKKLTGMTDTSGRFTAEGLSDASISSKVTKDGYYDGAVPVMDFHDYDTIENRWLPWDSIYKVVLRPVGHQATMYARRGWFEIPAVDVPCAFDCEVGDWVEPIGKGKKSDINVTLRRRYAGKSDFDMVAEIRFGRPKDGIRKIELPSIGKNSEFIWPREAPEDGYQTMLSLHFSRKPGTPLIKDFLESDAYVFRVRSIENKIKGVNALYGKMRDIDMTPYQSKTGYIYILLS